MGTDYELIGNNLIGSFGLMTGCSLVYLIIYLFYGDVCEIFLVFAGIGLALFAISLILLFVALIYDLADRVSDYITKV